MIEYFTPLQRTLHWLMAAMVLAMLFIGIGMVSTLHPKFLTLIAIHRPLGIAILLLALFRLGVRLRRGAPPLPADLPHSLAIGAKASHYLLYALLIAMPLIGWAMLSAGGYPIVLGGPIHLPKIMPHNDELYAFLRSAHTILRISALRDRPSPCRGCALPRADTAGRRVSEHGGAMVVRMKASSGCVGRLRATAASCRCSRAWPHKARA